MTLRTIKHKAKKKKVSAKKLFVSPKSGTYGEVFSVNPYQKRLPKNPPIIWNIT